MFDGAFQPMHLLIVLVIVVLALARKARQLGPTDLGKPYNREMRF